MEPQPAFSPGTPWTWRLGIGGVMLGVGGMAYWLQDVLGSRGQAAAGVVCLLSLVALFSSNLRAVSGRTFFFGLGLQFLLAWFVLRFEIHGFTWLDIPDGYAPGRELFGAMARVITLFMSFTLHGAEFVFGILANEEEFGSVVGARWGFILAFSALTTIIFVSSFFTVLYFFGIVQWVVRGLARAMIYLLGTSGAETLSTTANVFMGQTEAPLIVRPYVARMTQSELLTLMVGGMATISGGLMAVYVSFGADAISLLATSVMAAPCALYLSKLMLPETEEPETRGHVRTDPERTHQNAIDAAAGGASDGMYLALNVAAMLIAFLAFLALIDAVLGALPTGRSMWDWLRDVPDEVGGYWIIAGRTLMIVTSFVLFALLARRLGRAWLGETQRERFAAMVFWAGPVGRATMVLAAFGLYLVLLDQVLMALPEGLSLRVIFSSLFAPLAFFIGVEAKDLAAVADLLGTKLVSNEFVAYVEMGANYREQFSPRTLMLTAFALTGFANFGSIGIQLGGIAAMAPAQRGELARLGLRALFVGYVATLLNAAIAGIML